MRFVDLLSDGAHDSQSGGSTLVSGSAGWRIAEPYILSLRLPAIVDFHRWNHTTSENLLPTWYWRDCRVFKYNVAQKCILLCIPYNLVRHMCDVICKPPGCSSGSVLKNGLPTRLTISASTLHTKVEAISSSSCHSSTLWWNSNSNSQTIA